MEMTIARAMKHRVRVASRLRKIEQDIQSCNSCLGDQKPEVDVITLMNSHEILTKHLIDLRVAIDAASAPIKRDLFAMAEKRSKMTFLQGIVTTNGFVQQHSYRTSESAVMEYRAVYRKSDIDEMIIQLETELDAIQQNLDTHNAVTKIQIEIPETFKNPSKK